MLNVRTAEGRRLRDLADGYAAELGGWAALSDTLAVTVRMAAELVVIAERYRHEALLGSGVDPAVLAKVQNTAARAVRALGIKSGKQLTRIF